ncbi:EamA family transporter [Arthrobacter sp. FW305-123]|nr:EamA family transporter [Arthrobacter sp. FW305-123]
MRTPQHLPVPPWGLAVAAMISVQLSSAFSVGLIGQVGAAGTAWLRLSMGAIIFLAIARPPLRSIRKPDILPLLGLGIATGLMTIMFLAAIERIPLGTTVAIEFLGPLTVAAIRSHNRKALAWPALALAGVVLLTEPWHGEIDALGVMFAAIAAVGWGAYILLTQKIGDRFTGTGALSLTVPVAAVTAAIVGVPQAAGHLSVEVLLAALGVAVLMPVLPFILEMMALRRMTSNAFGTLMSLEPAFGVLLGLLVLHQQPSIVQFIGITLVVLAGAAAQRGGRRNPPSAEAVLGLEPPLSNGPGKVTTPASTPASTPGS